MNPEEPEIRNQKIVDCFIFYNELDMLEYRLSVMYSYVDAFVVVESTRTHKGSLKPLYYQENSERYAKYADKIVHVIVDDLFAEPRIEFDLQKGEQWFNEKHQRDGITIGIDILATENTNRGWKLEENDLLLVSDVDEIIDMSKLKIIQNSLIHPESKGIIFLPMDMYYYHLKNKIYDTWTHSKAISYLYYQNIPYTTYKNLKSFRNVSDGVRHINSCIYPNVKLGWHLSYFGDEYMVSNKLKEFAHQEFNSSIFTNPEYIKERMENGVDILGRTIENINFQRIEFMENTYLPPFPPCLEEGIDPWTCFPFSL